MTSLIKGYCCPICNVVAQAEICPRHPDTLMDLHLENRYGTGQLSGQPLHIYRRFDNFQKTIVVCTMPGTSQMDEDNVDRIGAALTACREISSAALSRGYIQTLQQLSFLVTDHLSNPSAGTEERLLKQLALVQLRGRAGDRSLDLDEV